MKKEADIVKACCADFYQQAAVKFFLGDSFHPGGLQLTESLAERLGISKSSNVLDVACGEGTSAFFIADRFGGNVTGTDASEKAILRAREKAKINAVTAMFLKADSDALPFPDGHFDCILTECSFSTFFDKAKTVKEIHRVLKPGGKWGLSDMLVDRNRLPETMRSLLLRSEPPFRKFTCENVSEQVTSAEGALFQAGCIGQAENFQGYAKFMQNSGFLIIEQQDVSWALEEMMAEVERRLSAARLLIGYGNLPVKSEDLNSVEQLLSEGRDLLKEKIIGYGILIGQKPV